MCDIHTVRAYDSIGKLSVFGSKVKKGETIYEHTHTKIFMINQLCVPDAFAVGHCCQSGQ